MIYEPVLKDRSVVFLIYENGIETPHGGEHIFFQTLVIFGESTLGNLVRLWRITSENHQPFTEGATPLYTCLAF